MTKRIFPRTTVIALVSFMATIASIWAAIAWETRDRRPDILRNHGRVLTYGEAAGPTPGLHLRNRTPEITRRILAAHPIGSRASLLREDLAGMGFKISATDGRGGLATFRSETSLMISWIYKVEWAENGDGRIASVASDMGGIGL